MPPRGGLPDLDRECFVAAPIGPTGSDERRRADQVLEFVVGPAAREAGLTAVRADLIAQPGTITLQVIDHVVRAAGLVADLTSQNPNVFYEVGIRHAFARPTVLIAEDGTGLPFDIGHERTIFFNHRDLASANACREEITLQLQESLRGDVRSPVSTAVDIQALRAGSPLEQQVARLVDEYQSLTASQRHILEVLRQMWPMHIAGPASFVTQLDLQPYVKSLEGNLVRLRRELKGASGINSGLVEAILRDSFSVVRGIEAIVEETRRAARTGELLEALTEEPGGPRP